MVSKFSLELSCHGGVVVGGGVVVW